ncbi:MAG: hypothetical protein SVX38_06545 [Chloroflexota bacterium]|nr:hypothetical protein [Chloroflexota bacterium]
MVKKLILTLGLAIVMLGGLFAVIAFADGPVFDLDQGDENFRVIGENTLDWLGEVASGDVNDDGVSDLIIGATGYDHAGMNDAGLVTVIWGGADLSGTLDLNSTGQMADLIIYGGEESAVVGHAVDSGDWNHDGVDDIVIGADGVSNWQGAVYVITGSSSLSHTIYLTDTTASHLTVYGQFDGDRLGRTVAIGDVNGDEWQDLIIGSYWADPSGRPRAGTVYVIFGSSEVSGTIDLSAGDEADVTIYGALTEDWTGRWVDHGDINGDGVQDILIGASRGDVPGRTDAGKVVVIYGGEAISSTSPITIDLASRNIVSEGLGLVFYGVDEYDGTGFFVSSGNVNGDTGPQGQDYDDLIVTAYRDGHNEDGEAYIIYGGPAITSGVTITPGTWGINISDCVDVTIYPGATGDRLGRSAASSDFNGDGYADVMVGAPRVDRTATITDVGHTYVIYGAPSLSATINVSPTSNVDILVIGDDVQDESGRACGAGDLNDDGVDDLIIGAAMALSETGEVYAVWGPKATSISLEPASTIITGGHSVAYAVTATNAYTQSYDATNYLTSYDSDDAAGGSWSDNAYTAGNDGTWIITATHRGLIDTAELIVDGTAPVITEVGVTSDDEDHFHDPGLTAEGGKVYFNSLAGEGTGQMLTVAVTMTEADPISLTGGSAFGSIPQADTDGADGWTVTYTVSLEPGDQTGIPFTVTDQVWLTDQAVIDFIEDNDPPTGTVTAPAGQYVNSVQPEFASAAGDAKSGVASVLFQYRLSGTGVYTDVSTATAKPYQAEWGSESLTDGQTHDLRVIVTDNVGNVYTSEAITVTCDITAPESGASSPEYTNSSPIAVEWTATDGTSGVASTALYVRAEGGSWADSGLPAQAGTNGTFTYTPSADGTYYFQTVSTDNAGNQETVPSGDTGTGDDSTAYDTTDPTGSVTAPTGPYVNDTQPEFTADADDATSGVASVLFQYGLSGTGVYTDVSTDTAAPYQAVWGSESLTDSLTYNLRVMITDNAGNDYTSDVVTVTCDSSMPTMETIAEAEGQYYTSAPVFSNFGFDDNDDLDDGWYQIDSHAGTWTALFTDVSGPSWDDDGWAIPGFDALSEGSHTIYFRASDDVGNEMGAGGEWSWQFYKDTTIPSASVVTPTGTQTSISVIQGTATDNDGAGLSKVELQVTDGTNYLQPDDSWTTSEAWLTPTGLESWSYDTSGVSWAEIEYTARVRTTDQVGNVGVDTSTFTYEVPAGPTQYIYLPILCKGFHQ